MRYSILATLVAVALTGCKPTETTSTSHTSASSEQSVTAPISAEVIEKETARLNEWFETKYEENILRSPIALTFQGRPERKGEIDQMSEAAIDESLAITKANLAELTSSFDYDKLSDDAKISYDIWVYQAKAELESDKYRYNSYVFEQMQAVHSFFPQLLIAFHSVTTEQDMIDFNSRIKETGRALNQLIEFSQLVAEKGVRPPYFAFDAVISESKSIITGAPFTEGEDSAVWASAKDKIAALVKAGTIDAEKAESLREVAKANLLNDFLPAYQKLIAWQEKDRVNAGDKASGVGALPNGIDYYNERLANQTTTSLTADEIHNIGLSEVKRIRAQMELIKTKFGFEGDLADFFVFLRDTKDDTRLYYPNTDEGRQGYLDDATAAIDNIKTLLPDYFGILPKADMVVKRVESFREQDGAAQHYFPPTLDGSRPGIYYAHLSDMTAMPKRELEVIAYHEGLPGHHMQIAIAQELESVPTFRTQAGFTAYIEGWALYSEWLATEMPGTFSDPLSDFGRLGSEIWRAIRLVVDTGLHAKGWSEQQAIDYFKANSAVTETQAISEVRRYLAIPGQATSYKIGMLKIQKLRASAEKELGDKFDIKGFHDVVLGGGAVPLDVLELQVNNWVNSLK
ncbi:DUF885 domain-containing protein [Alteromonas sp. 5E99-2]|uniref:DUF885 domain-containing protein n=1 Tax=Alteromonas sp. 5E99-2 TaxID=2817683 RepID=UPI001A9975FD|nr:DUF885 domain-containing protein [Alteromonas sp. 5E99-2]MBO1254703.1 DUF885 domain-containing protein [Alteromonas sp. 5E99-2]